MSDQDKCTGMKSNLLNNLYGIFMLVGPACTFAVGVVIIFRATINIDEFMSTMMMQVAPSQGFIAEMIAGILIETIVGFVLILYPICVFGGDDQ